MACSWFQLSKRKCVRVDVGIVQLSSCLVGHWWSTWQKQIHFEHLGGSHSYSISTVTFSPSSTIACDQNFKCRDGKHIQTGTLVSNSLYSPTSGVRCFNMMRRPSNNHGPVCRTPLTVLCTPKFKEEKTIFSSINFKVTVRLPQPCDIGSQMLIIGLSTQNISN